MMVCYWNHKLLEFNDSQFTFCSYGQDSCANRLSCAIDCLACVQSGMLRKSVNYDKCGSVCHLIEMEDNIFGWPYGFLVVIPADFWLRHTGHTSMESGHFPVIYGAAQDRLHESGTLTNWFLLNTWYACGETGCGMPLFGCSVLSVLFSCKEVSHYSVHKHEAFDKCYKIYVIKCKSQLTVFV